VGLDKNAREEVYAVKRMNWGPGGDRKKGFWELRSSAGLLKH